MKNKTFVKRGNQKMLQLLLLILIVILIINVIIQYNIDIKKAYKILDNYDKQSFVSEFGTMSYIDGGNCESILISHGIFGGYDQGIISLNQLVGSQYRKLSPSRFGYPGSDLPENPTPQNQAKAYVALLDELGIEKTYILCTSAGGASGIQFALNYPERAKGLILLSSGAPDKKRTAEEVKELGMMGPPNIFVNDFPMWFSLKYLGFIMDSMLGGDINGDDLIKTMLPVSLRRDGIIADTEITNIDMTLNYDDYPLESLEVPILVIHAKDDPMAKYEDIEKLLERVNAETAIYETGGHMIVGQDCSVQIEKFMNENNTANLP